MTGIGDRERDMEVVRDTTGQLSLLLGIQGVDAGISELSAAFSLAIEMGARLEDVAGTIFAHPTLSEGMLEAALKTLGQPIHI